MTNTTRQRQPTTQGHELTLGRDGGGPRHFLDGQPVHAGAALDLLMPSGKWLPVRYESAYPHARLLVAVGPARRHSDDDVETGTAELILRDDTWEMKDHHDAAALSRARFRWPDKDWSGARRETQRDDVLDVAALQERAR